MIVNNISAQIIILAMVADFTFGQVDVVVDQNFFIKQNGS